MIISIFCYNLMGEFCYIYNYKCRIIFSYTTSNVYCHNINLLRHLLGQTPNVDYFKWSNQDTSVAVLNFKTHQAVFEGGHFGYRGWDEITEIYFEQGRLRLETPLPLLRNVPAKVELYQSGCEPKVLVPQIAWTWAFRRQAEAFIRDILEGNEPLTNGADAVEDIGLVEEMWKMATCHG